MKNRIHFLLFCLTGIFTAQAATRSVGTGQNYATIQAAVTASNTGDIVEVHQGTYREAVSIPREGITLQPYGSDVVTINGCDVLTTWTSVGNGVYSTTLNSFITDGQSDQIFVDGKMLNLTRWPKLTSKDANGYYDLIYAPENAKATTVTEGFASGSYSFNKANLFPSDADAAVWKDAQFWLNLSNNRGVGLDGQGWTGTVSNALAGAVIANGCGGHGINDAPWGLGINQEFYVFNPTYEKVFYYGGTTLIEDGVKKLLAEGEWWKDETTLYVKLPGGGVPSATGTGTNVVEAKMRPYSFAPSSSNGLKNTTIKGFKLFATSITTDLYSANRGSVLTSASGNVIDGLDVKYVTHFTDQAGNWQMQWSAISGIVVSGENNVIKNCNFQFSAASAVSVLGNNNKVLNNNMLDMNYNVTEAGAINSGRYGFTCTDSEIAYNTITNVCQQGSNMRQFQNADETTPGVGRFHHNVINNFMIRANDSGGFDTFGNDKVWTRIDHNIFANATNNLAVGIYADYDGRMVIDHNLFWNVNSPVQLNQSGSQGYKPMRVYNNTAFGSASKGIFNGIENWGTSFDVRNNIATGGFSTPPAGSVVSNNLGVSSNATKATLFVNYTANDYSLKSPNQSTINAGVIVPYCESVTDGKPDLGCYEYGVPKWEAGYGKIQSEFALVDSVAGFPALGEVSTYNIKVKAVGYCEFAGTSVALSLGELPTGVTASLSANTVAIGGSITLTIHTTAECVNSETLKLTGISDGQTFVRNYRFSALPVATTITIDSLAKSLVKVGDFYTFKAYVLNQDGNIMNPQPTLTWTAVGGTINAAGKYVVSSLTNTASVSASIGGVSGTLNFATPFTYTAPVIPSAIDETSNKTLEIYPNPAQSEVTIRFPMEGGNTTVRILDVAGRVLYSCQMVSEEMQTIDLSAFSTGIYLLIAKQGDRILSKKLMITK